MKRLLQFLPIALPMLLASCAKEESDDLPVETPIYQDYKVLFDKPENRTRAYATFRKNSSLGVRLQLTGGSSITFNGNSYTTYTELDNYFYRWAADGMVDVVFRYTKEGVGQFVNTIARADTNDIDVPNGVVISRTNGGQVYWWGIALEPGETVSAKLKQGSTTTSSVTVTTSGAESIQLPPSLMTNLAAGTADLYLTRTRTLGLQQADGGAGGRRIVEVEARGTVTLE
jgi:hypothetical protein